MIFHEIRLLANNSQEISFLISYKKIGKMSQNLSSAAVMIGALRVKEMKLTEKSIRLHTYWEYTVKSLKNVAKPNHWQKQLMKTKSSSFEK